MSPYVIATALPDDAEAIATVQVLTWQAAYKGLLPDSCLDTLDIDQRTGEWRRLLANSAGHALVARQHDQIIGFCDFGPSRDAGSSSAIGELYTIYLLPQHWGQSIGSALIVAALRELRGRGFDQVTCWVLSTNTRAIRFYEKHDFLRDGTVKTDQIQGTLLNEIRMRRLLPNNSG